MENYEKLNDLYNKSCSLNDKYEEMLVLMDRWIKNLQSGKKVVSFFEKKCYKNIAIHGTSWLSQRLQQELQDTDVVVQLVFDKNSIETIKKHEVDVIVVTSLYYFYEIQRELENLTKTPIVSIGSIIYLTSDSINNGLY